MKIIDIIGSYLSTRASYEHKDVEKIAYQLYQHRHRTNQSGNQHSDWIKARSIVENPTRRLIYKWKLTISQTLSLFSAPQRWFVKGVSGKSSWEWMELLIIPLFLAIGAFYLEIQVDSRQQKAATQRYEQDILIADRRVEQETLNNYFGQMKELLIEQSLRNSSEDSEVRSLARAITTTTIRDLSSERNVLLINFLRGSNLIQKEKLQKDSEDKYVPLLVGVDLSNVDLSGADLSGADLTGANLSDANLRGADLAEADLNDANLGGTNFSSANLSRTDLSKAKLHGVRGTSSSSSVPIFSNANLNDANLSNTDLSQIDFSHARFLNADLSGASSQGFLVGSEYSRNSIGRWKSPTASEVSFIVTNFHGAKFINANLSNADFSGPDRTILRGIEISGFRIEDFGGKEAGGIDFTGAKFDGANLNGTNLSNANLKDTNLSEKQLEKSYICRAILPSTLSTRISSNSCSSLP